MKIDQDYLKGLLEAFQSSESPDTDINQLKEQGYDCEKDAFIFHMRLLEDRNLIVRSDGESGFGAFQSLDGQTHWAVMPLRLTAIGHDFIDALKNKEVWSKLKTGFKDASMGTLMTVSKELFNRALAKQMDKIFD